MPTPVLADGHEGSLPNMEELERYNKSFEEHIVSIEEETDARLQSFRRQCVSELINKLTRQQAEWEATFRELLDRSREYDLPEFRSVSFAEKPSIKIIDDQPLIPADNKQTTTGEKPPIFANPQRDDQSLETKQIDESAERPKCDNPPLACGGGQVDSARAKPAAIHKVETPKFDDPFPSEALDYFTNHLAVREFIRIQERQEQNRELFAELNTSPSLKPFKNELNLFIRTQINSISNSNHEHLATKIRLLVDLFSGRGVTFQGRFITASAHPQGQMFAMDLTAQTFVTVGTRLVNSVPAIAKSMAIVINGIVKSNLPEFMDLIIGHLQERCPYIIPMYPKESDFGDQQQADAKIRYKIACGYSYDIKTRALENEDKYLSRMRSMVLIFACILVAQDNKGAAWTWLASFLSLRPEPVITPTVLQAFLQETSRSLDLAFRRQYRKLHIFMCTDYMKMIEQVTMHASERQPLIKLKNQLAGPIV